MEQHTPLRNEESNDGDNKHEIELQPQEHHHHQQPRDNDDVSVASMASSLATMSLITVRDSVVFAVAHWKVLIFGQVLSFMLACSGATQATLHYECSLSAPTFSSGLFYGALSFNLIPLYLKGKKLKTASENMQDDLVAERASYWFFRVIPLQAPSWVYLIVAFLDVEANYVTVLAFRYTTLASVSLFDSLAIPSAMVLSRILLGRQHSWIHLVGVICCMVGVMYNALADYESILVGSILDGGEDYPDKLKGDVLAIIGGLLFGASDVLAEMAVRNFGGPTEFLGMMGIFATLISVIQGSILEREEIVHFFAGVPEPDGKVCPTSTGLFLLFAFVVINVLSYTATAWFLVVSEATFLNLSLLTGDLWSVLFMIVAEGIVPQPLFWAALTMITSGVLIYEIAPPSTEGRVEFSLLQKPTEPSKSKSWDIVSVHEDAPHLAEGMAEVELL